MIKIKKFTDELISVSCNNRYIEFIIIDRIELN